MKKEVLIAIIIGFTLGLIITFGVYNAKKSIENRDRLNNPASDNETVGESTAQSSHFINLTSPENYSVHDQEELTLTGITSPNSMIAILNNEYESLSSTDHQGNFSVDVELDAGENVITIAAYNPAGEKAKAQINVIYSTADLNDIDNDTEESEDSENEE